MHSEQYILDITNMKCEGCIKSVKSAISELGDVKLISISLEDHKAVVSSTRPVNELIMVITNAGFPTKLDN